MGFLSGSKDRGVWWALMSVGSRPQDGFIRGLTALMSYGNGHIWPSFAGGKKKP